MERKDGDSVRRLVSTGEKHLYSGNQIFNGMGCQVASGIQIGSLESGALQALRHIVDVHLRNILQQAHKFQRRSKSALLKGVVAF